MNGIPNPNEYTSSKLNATDGVVAASVRIVPRIGRTHGVHSEPITFGLKLALWYSEFKRHEKNYCTHRFFGAF